MTEIPGEFPLPEEAAQRQRSLLGAHIEAGRRSARTTRRGLVAVAVVILVGGLLVTPALGIGSRLLDLIESAPGRPDVQTPVWSPDGRQIAFLSRRDGDKERLRRERRRERAAEAGARREVLRHSCLVARRADRSPSKACATAPPASTS